MPGERVLVSGGGPAGSILAYWLGKNDFKVTVIERGRVDVKLGQGLEIEEPALQVINKMDIMPQLRQVKTGEAGFTLRTAGNKSCGTLRAGEFISPTGSLEMMRGDMVEVFYRNADEASNVQYRFQTSMKSIKQTEDKVVVELEDKATSKKTTEEFDFLLGSDGLRSRTRQMVFGPDEETKCLHPLGISVAYFNIPRAPQDYPYSQMCNFPGRRIAWTRPIGEKSDQTSVYFIHAKEASKELHEANISGDRQKQKECFASIYGDLGWEVPRIVAGMLEADNFYSDELTQVKLPRWSKGRVALVGDAAWAPTPVTGQGNQLAIIGAWVLAQELGRHRSTKGFDAYEERLRDYVSTAQQVPLGGRAPFIFNPDTQWGISILQNVFWVASGLVWLAAKAGLGRFVPSDPENQFDLQMEGQDPKTMSKKK